MSNFRTRLKFLSLWFIGWINVCKEDLLPAQYFFFSRLIEELLHNICTQLAAAIELKIELNVLGCDELKIVQLKMKTNGEWQKINKN